MISDAITFSKQGGVPYVKASCAMGEAGKRGGGGLIEAFSRAARASTFAAVSLACIHWPTPTGIASTVPVGIEQDSDHGKLRESGEFRQGSISAGTPLALAAVVIVAIRTTY